MPRGPCTSRAFALLGGGPPRPGAHQRGKIGRAAPVLPGVCRRCPCQWPGQAGGTHPGGSGGRRPPRPNQPPNTPKKTLSGPLARVGADGAPGGHSLITRVCQGQSGRGGKAASSPKRSQRRTGQEGMDAVGMERGGSGKRRRTAGWFFGARGPARRGAGAGFGKGQSEGEGECAPPPHSLAQPPPWSRA